MLRYERFRHEVLHQRGFHLCIDTITADDIRDFKLWMQEEYKYVDMYPVFYRNEKHRDVGQKRSENSMSGSLYRIRTVVKWCIKRGLTVNTAVEAVVDLATEEKKPLAKIAKDTAAGAVLIAAIASVIVGLLIFVPHVVTWI